MGYRDNPGNAVIATYTQLEMLDRAHIRQIPAPEPFSKRSPFERRGVIANTLSYLLMEAHKAREHALSYRNFRVGAAAMVLYWREGVEYQTYIHGANMKPTTADDINVHAEHVLMRSIEQHIQPGDEVSVPVLAVIGDYQNDQQSGQATKTLHPCGVCRDDFSSFRRPSFADTLFVTARKDMQIIEWFNLADMNRFHQDDAQNELSFAQFDHPLDILQPIDTTPHSVIRIEDTACADEELFDEKVKFPIIIGY